MKSILILTTLFILSVLTGYAQTEKPTDTTKSVTTKSDSAKVLKAVTVTAKRPLIEQKADRTIVNVEAAITNAGSNALEVLEKSPGVTVDKDGLISLKGKEGVMVLIDNRPTQLSGPDLANMLRNMNATQLDQIEIMTNPPARYDAAGNAGIINIKTKKTTTLGYNGTATLGYTQGRYPKANAGLNFNYRKGKVNWFSNLGYNNNQGFSEMSIKRNLINNSGQLVNFFDQQSYRDMHMESFNAKVGADFFASKKNTFGFVVTGFINPSEIYNTTSTDIFTPTKSLESITRATVDNSMRWKSLSTNFNFRRVIDAKGKEWTADVDLIRYGSANNQFMVNSYYDGTGEATTTPDTLQGALPQEINIYSGRVDYIHPFNKTTRFEGGLKSSIVRTDANAAYDSIQNGLFVRDINRSNHFVYEENINAAYVNLSTELSKKWSAQGGLRLENTNATGDQLTTGQEFNRNYTQLFPTAFLQYKATEKHTFRMNYGRRIRRPNYESLNPFIRFIDRYTYSEGNPNLKPQLSNNIELSHSFKNIVTTTLNYTATNDILQNVIEQKGTDAYSKPSNIASLQQLGLAVSVNTPITKWWTGSFYVNVFNNHFKGVVNTTPISFSATSFAANAMQQFNITKTFAAELSGVYRSGRVEGVLHAKPMGMVAAGFSKQIMKKKGTIRVNVRDIFYTVQQRATIKYGNVDAQIHERRDTRVVSLGFTYRFTKGKTAPARKRTTGSAGDEENRVGIE